LSGLADRIRDRVQDLRQEVLPFLRELVEINSYSRNYEGVNRAGEMVSQAMPAGLGRRVQTDRNGVRHHILENRGAEGEAVVMVGHVDTVLPPNSSPGGYEERDGLICGPGTADMKGGIAVMVFALRILDEMGMLAGLPVRVLVNGDEEIGSPHSARLVRELGQDASFGLVFECGGLDGQVVYYRRGIRRFRLTVTGKARHAGVKTGGKASAIVELSRMILALEAMNDDDSGVTINVGKISGGTASNVVPDRARASFEFRFWDDEMEERIMERIQGIVRDVRCPECGAKLICHHRRPAGCPVDGTDRLYARVARAARQLGQKVGKEKRGGTSDANFLIAEGVATVDGLGPVGDLDHSPDEYIVEESLYDRIALTALVLANLKA
jgi:glutamate carboxypeptidase